MTEIKKMIFVVVVGVVVYISRVVKIEKHISSCRELSILYIEDRVIIDHVANNEINLNTLL